ncbi:hypothetical protein CFC21_040278 [Triticum aestivum]|uniref:WRKY domain-containing protein n=2 Tax=Triticum aestivum TaxID=4565 RepID=A0A9R1FGU5_WHEAT|nr:probable WRKY transcription factor 13 [Triticum aestivum]KAF7028334.1 hypothetical protein CFC21_040278 [Triticum aestivum]
MMFPSPGGAAMALAHGQAASTGATTAGGTATAITFSFQPSDPPLNGGLSHHHGLLGYSPLVLDHPTTTTSSSSTIPAAPTLHHLHGHAHAGAIHPPRSSPPHPWSCEEADRERQMGEGAVVGMGVNSVAAGGSGGGGRSHGSAAAAAGMGVGAVRMKKAAGGGGVKARRKVREPRFCFKTMSDVDVLDDGYKWRKYGQKVVIKNTQHPRSYYRCTQDKCRVKKRVERLAEDPRMVITTYEGRHVHSPSRDDDDAARASAEMSFIW